MFLYITVEQEATAINTSVRYASVGSDDRADIPLSWVVFSCIYITVELEAIAVLATLAFALCLLNMMTV